MILQNSNIAIKLVENVYMSEEMSQGTWKMSKLKLYQENFANFTKTETQGFPCLLIHIKCAVVLTHR